MDLPGWLSLWQVLQRQFKYRSNNRPELPLGRPEKFDLEFYWSILTYSMRKRPALLKQLAQLPQQQILILRSAAAVAEFLAGY